MVECMNPALPISQQCRLLALPRSSVYRKPAEVGAEDVAIMALIDRHYLARPYYGSRRMAAWLATQGHHVNRKRVQRLMRLLGLAAIYQRPNTSKPAVAHKIYPYLLRGLAIERVNQVWCSDITYIPMAKGFLYLVVVMDWVSRAVLAWRLSNTLDADFCVEALRARSFFADRATRRPPPRCLTVTLDEFISIAGYHRKHVIWRRCFRRCWWPTNLDKHSTCSVSSRTSRRCAPVPQAASWTRPARDALPEAGRLRGMVRLVSPRNAIWILDSERRHPKPWYIQTRSVPDVA